MYNEIKHANILTETSNTTFDSVVSRCKEHLKEAKSTNKDKLKQKKVESQQQSSEIKAMKFMVSQKMMKYSDARKQLDDIRRENKKMNLEKMLKDLFNIR
mmetsp:Transcript_1876/g.1784  ORF Transcript_1876/g.1784 Transcript_1876/m.1784 type:complete len:100 (+) Transcript_1876:2-301(+)